VIFHKYTPIWAGPNGIAGYMKAVKEKLISRNAPEATVTQFEKGAQGYAKKIIANFKDYDFYTGETMDPDGM